MKQRNANEAVQALARNLTRAMDESKSLKTQSALSRKSRVSQTTVGRILAGTTDAKIGTVSALGRAFRVPPCTLLDDGLPASYWVNEPTRQVTGSSFWATAGLLGEHHLVEPGASVNHKDMILVQSASGVKAAVEYINDLDDEFIRFASGKIRRLDAEFKVLGVIVMTATRRKLRPEE